MDWKNLLTGSWEAERQKWSPSVTLKELTDDLSFSHRATPSTLQLRTKPLSYEPSPFLLLLLPSILLPLPPAFSSPQPPPLLFFLSLPVPFLSSPSSTFCSSLCDKTFLGGETHLLTPDREPQQTKVQIPRKSSLVKQWILLGSLDCRSRAWSSLHSLQAARQRVSFPSDLVGLGWSQVFFAA